jgi:hypothetical protein
VIDARRLVWEAAGRPVVIDGEGVPVRADGTGACGRCGDPHGAYAYGDIFSENFWPARTMGQLQGHSAAGGFCAACAWSVRALSLRCAAWVATEAGVWFVPQRHLLAVLLDPPAPPFVVAWPRYGIAHGGEAHAWRAHFRGSDPIGDADRLTRLQAKHCAVYAEVAWSRDRFPLQVDDALTLDVDRALWTRLAAQLLAVAARMAAEGVGPRSQRECLAALKPPSRRSLALARDWPALTRGLSAHVRAPWWEPLVALLPVPDATKPEAPVKAAKAAPTPSTTPAPTKPPAAPPQPQQRSLFGDP